MGNDSANTQKGSLMTISSSMNAGVSGLAANASRLATISDNIANSATYGYKTVRSDFHSLVVSSGGSSYSAGGVRNSSQRLIDEKGTIVSTKNSTDLATRGRGFLPVTSTTSLGAAAGEMDTKLVTTGSFRLNSEGYLTTAGGLALIGWKANPDGTIPNYPKDSFAALSPVQVNMNELVGERTSKISISANLPATSTMAGATGGNQTLSTEYFDNLAKSEALSIDFVPTAPATGSSNEWTMTVRDTASGGAVIGSYTLTFDDSVGGGGLLASVTAVSGGAYTPATGNIALTTAGGLVELNIGKLNTRGGLSQISNRFAPGSITKNGFPPGNLTSVEVDEKGIVQASYENGMQRTIAQIPMVDVPNPNGLRVNDDQTYRPSKESGQFLLWNAGEGPTGGIRSYAREESATDVAGELTELIKTQRAYSSNAKVIQTVDEMMQETTNMKR